MKSWVVTLVLCFVSVSFLSHREFSDSNQGFAPPAEGEKWAEETLSKLALEKKVAQLVFIDIAGGYVPERDHRLQDWLRHMRAWVGL